MHRFNAPRGAALGCVLAAFALQAVAAAPAPQSQSRAHEKTHASDETRARPSAARVVDYGTSLAEDALAHSPAGLDLTAHEYATPEPTAPARVRATAAGITANWWSYRIDTGDHTANVIRGSEGSRPRHGFAWNTGRTYRFAFDSNAEYVLAAPYMADPADQADWNKLPGFSDCGNISLAKNGAMFGWRWNVQRTVLEITAYWNNDGAHRTPPEPLVTLTRAELASGDPLRYEVTAGRDAYTFSISGTIAGRAVNASTTAPRACPGRNRLKWNSAFYFGGTSVAPHTITGRIDEE